MQRRSHAFTLVEVLMVLAIIGISLVVSMPSLVKSIRGNRLRVGARTVVMAGNYARTMAILRNQDIKLVLDKGAGTVSVEPLRTAPVAPSSELAFGGPAPLEPLGASGTDEPAASAPPPISLSRKLDAVRIDSVKIEKREAQADEPATIIYLTNGRCNPYEVRVVDEFGSVMVITVDAVASAKVRKEGE